MAISDLHIEVDFEEDGSLTPGHVHFSPRVGIKLIPTRYEYSEEDKARMWFSTFELLQLDLALEYELHFEDDENASSEFPALDSLDLPVLYCAEERSCDETRDDEGDSCRCPPLQVAKRAKPKLKHSDAFYEHDLTPWPQNTAPPTEIMIPVPSRRGDRLCADPEASYQNLIGLQIRFQELVRVRP